MPARTVQHEHDLFARACTDLLGKCLEFHGEELDAHRRRQVPHCTPRGGMHEADDVAPRIAMLDRGDGALARERPGLAQNGLEANAMFVHGPQLDGRVGKGRRHLPQQRGQMLLEVGLGLRVGSHVTRPRDTQACAQTPQVGPAELTTDTATETLADPGGDRPPAPTLAFGCFSCR
jgi:hypothetical protein